QEANKSPIVFIDLDEGASQFRPGLNTLKNEVKNTLSKGKGYIKASPAAAPSSTTSTTAKTTDVTFDDDDLFASGSGSGSGDDGGNASEANGRLTPTESTAYFQVNLTSATTEASIDLFSIEEGGTEHAINITGDEKNVVIDKRDNNINTNNVVVDHTFIDSDISDDVNGVDELDEDAIYDLPPATPVTSNQILNFASWGQWSDWFIIGATSKIRIRSCLVDGGRETSEVACDGVRVQLKSCESEHGDRCGKVQNISTNSDGNCVQTSRPKTREGVVKPPPPQPPPAPQTPPTEKPDPGVCHYSLFDNYRQKYVISRWNLTELMMKSKVKRWCDRKTGQYTVMTSPEDHCRRYYKDLCKVSDRCHANKPTKERGDFAEGCWRNLVYSEMLPVGLSGKQSAIYLICQRFAAQSRMGKLFGYKETLFGTLFDTNLRSPLVAINKITRLGDETWPMTDYFIEHGLVENESNMLWLFKKPRKGMLTLLDLDRCQDDQSCDVGLRQTLPHDYVDHGDTGYTPTHLMWPELMPNEPGPKVATFTMTNVAPMLSNLFENWHNTVKKVRQFAIEKCGVPVVVDYSVRHMGEFSSHRANQSALYLVSGQMPSVDPLVTTGRGIPVPFLFWMAGCCVQQHLTIEASISSVTDYDADHNVSSSDSHINITHKEAPKIVFSGFAVYIRNAPDNHVIPAPILQLEMLLQDMSKSGSVEGEVALFPGNNGACGDLRNDVSKWFQ
ncbi:endonuclease domain-containing 1 protein, partial [Biomphalaria pfeifferi]